MKRLFFYLTAWLFLTTTVSTAQTWPHPFPCRVQDSDNNDLFLMTLGQVDTPLAQGTFDPVKDKVTLKDGTVKANYYKESLNLPYYQALDKSHYPLPPSGWCTWYYYYYQHNVMWYVDPDIMVLRSPLTIEQARVWATLQGLTGQALMATDRMMDLGPQREEMLKRVYPAVDIRPLDLFPAKHNKHIWDLKVNHLGRQYDVVGVFNFGETENQTTHLKWADLGLPTDQPIHVFDFWNQDYLGAWEAGVNLDVAPTSCRVLTLLPSNGQIQLLSTNRHITQGWID